MACGGVVGRNWGLAVGYAQDDGSIDTFSVQRASEDLDSGQLTAPEVQRVFAMSDGGCSLADAVTPTITARAAGSTVTADAGISTPGGGVEAVVEVSMAGAIERVTVTDDSDGTVTFEAGSGGDYDVCADLVSVVPA